MIQYDLSFLFKDTRQKNSYSEMSLYWRSVLRLHDRSKCVRACIYVWCVRDRLWETGGCND